MDIHIDTTDGPKNVRLIGRFDAHETAAARTALEPLVGVDTINIDLSGVNFIDSAGLAELVRLLKRSREQGGHLVLIAPSDPVRVIFELTGLDRAFTLAAS